MQISLMNTLSAWGRPTSFSSVILPEMTEPTAVCEICKVSHTQCSAPGVPASVCSRIECINANTTKTLEESFKIGCCNFCNKPFSWTMPGNNPMCRSDDCIEKLKNMYELARQQYHLHAYAARYGRLICHFCSHSFPPSENSFSQDFRYNTLEGQFLAENESWCVCFDCGQKLTNSSTF